MATTKSLGGASSGIPSSFFKVFLPNVSSERLKIPPAFLKHMQGQTSGTVSLTGPSGNVWLVNLIGTTDGLFLEQGWNIFLKDHFIEFGDFFVFRYDGNLCFDVQVFDQTACEKEAAFRAKCSQVNGDFVQYNGMKRVRGKEPEIVYGSSLKPFEVVIKRKRVSSPQVTQFSSGGEKKLTSQETREEVQRAALSFSSEFPYVVSCMKKYNVGVPSVLVGLENMVQSRMFNFFEVKLCLLKIWRIYYESGIVEIKRVSR
uniref:TF-B3 domain-containing protein n=1 Tax=Nelumbo nucifera TaxID=4432 RepID=A0A822ZTK9_NELNU|nr:TPA_asm: hypothetical protein HUJ06_016808 [Nelumbo nucifera]